MTEARNQGFAARYLILFGGEAFSKVCVLLAFAYLARVLSPSSYGTVELALSVTMFFVLGVESGMGSYGARMVAAQPRLNRDTLYVFKRIHHGQEVDPHINTYLITRRGYFKAGGYDEDFAGHYGYEDVVFRNMWRKYVGSEVLLADIAFTQMGWRTNNLDRDTTRNHALAQYKAALGLPKPKGALRFEWAEAE